MGEYGLLNKENDAKLEITEKLQHEETKNMAKGFGFWALKQKWWQPLSQKSEHGFLPLANIASKYNTEIVVDILTSELVSE